MKAVFGASHGENAVVAGRRAPPRLTRPTPPSPPSPSPAPPSDPPSTAAVWPGSTATPPPRPSQAPPSGAAKSGRGLVGAVVVEEPL